LLSVIKTALLNYIFNTSSDTDQNFKFNNMINPLLTVWDTPFGTPPFDKIDIGNYKPGVEEAIVIAAR